MPEEKRRYSLISVDVASDEEPTVRVDAWGAHVVVPGEATLAGEDRPGAAQAQAVGEKAASSAKGRSADRAQAATRDAEDDGEADELGGSVPFAGMQRVIVALLLVVLVAGIVYFTMM